MSKESLEQFMQKVGRDEELRSSIESQLDSDGNITVDALIALGSAVSYTHLTLPTILLV